MMVSIITKTTKVNLQKAGCVSVTKLIILIPKLENVTVAGSNTTANIITLMLKPA